MNRGVAPRPPNASQPKTTPARPQPAVQPFVPPGAKAKVIQRKPSNNNDPNPLGSGTHYNRHQMVNVGGTSVPSRITAIIKNPGVGGVPSVSPPGWSWLQTKVGRLKGKWVRFHIVNRLLGGPGNQTWNLVPTSVAVNNSFSQKIEEDVKKSAKTKWTYLDVELNYNHGWPAPIPESIEAEWGVWRVNKWVKKKSITLDNPDITALDGFNVYLRGVNITQREMKKRKVRQSDLANFTNWLQNWSQSTDSDSWFMTMAEYNFTEFDPSWLNQVWLDEDVNGDYVPVVKALR